MIVSCLLWLIDYEAFGSGAGGRGEGDEVDACGEVGDADGGAG